ncbi:zinc ribbon domain-containing protein, partial [Streptomyces nigra]
MPRTRTPVIAGWFTGDGEGFRLLGTRCSACSTVFFPREDTHCRNPHCPGRRLVRAVLGHPGGRRLRL